MLIYVFQYKVSFLIFTFLLLMSGKKNHVRVFGRRATSIFRILFFFTTDIWPVVINDY